MLIALGVTGGIGAYKAVEVARGLQKRGHEVVAIMTASATRFVGPLTFEAITRRRVITDQFEPGANADIEHIALASSIDLLLVAPATANIIGKFANGIADDFLSTLYTATRAPVLIAPAMNTQMFAHEAVRRNLDTLAARGVRFVEPGEGYLACGWIGKGRLAEPDEIVAAAETVLRPAGPLRGPARARDRRTDLRGSRSGPLSSATGRAAGWALRSPPKPRAAAPRSRWSPARPPLEPPPVRRARARPRAPREMHARGAATRAERADVGDHGRGRRRLHAGRRGRRRRSRRATTR